MRYLTDFQKLSLCFALGMGIVVFGVGMKSDWNAEVVLLTFMSSLIPFGFWAFYEIRQDKLRRMRTSIDQNTLQIEQRRREAHKAAKEKLEILFGENPLDNPLAFVPLPHRGERRVLLPRDHELTKQRILQGRGGVQVSEEEIDERNQWFS